MTLSQRQQSIINHMQYVELCLRQYKHCFESAFIINGFYNIETTASLLLPGDDFSDFFRLRNLLSVQRSARGQMSDHLFPGLPFPIRFRSRIREIRQMFGVWVIRGIRDIRANTRHGICKEKFYRLLAECYIKPEMACR